MKRFHRVLVILCGIILAPMVTAADQPKAGKMIKVSPGKDDRIPYWLYLPKDYGDNKDKLPVVVFLHGMGERGSDLDRVLAHGPPKLISKGKHFPFIMIAPQCPNDGRKGAKNAKSFWWHPEGPIGKVKNIVDFEKKRLGRIDDDRVYITGLSMGGFGTYNIVSRHPGYFAAAAPICGHGNRVKDKKAMKKAFVDLAVWAFHGDRDNVVRLSEQQQTIDMLALAGATIKFTIYKGVGHDSWTRTYENPDFYKWLLAQKRGAIKK